MKRHLSICRPLILFILLATCHAFIGFAQSFPEELNGSMMTFDFAKCDTNPVWNNHYKPVYIAYISRHGARFLSSEKKVENLKKTLSEARNRNKLTEKGERFLSLLTEVDSVTDGRWGALNATGIEEQQRFADQMKRIAPSLLKEGRVNAIATYVPRVVMTMYQLTHRLIALSPQLEIYASEGHQYDSLLRFFHTDSAYQDYLEKGNWVEVYDRFVGKTIPTAPAQSMFKDTKSRNELQKLTLDMYGVLQSLPAARIDWKPEIWFDEVQYRSCWEAANLKHYLQRSVNRCSSLAATAAVPLLNNIIEKIERNSSDETSANRDVADMWFGHAETVMPLFALMRLPGCYRPDFLPQSVAKEWKDWEVSPLGANLMIVILKDEAGEKYASLRLNGKWIDMPGENRERGKIIRWDDLEKSWRESISGVK